MLENLLDLIKQNAGSAIISNPAIPNEQNDAAISETGSSIVDGLKKMIAGGNTQDVINLFNHQGGNIANTPAAQQISGGLIQNLMDKFGIGQGAASGIASNLVPQVLQQLVHKTNDPNDSSFNITSIVSHLAGGTQGQAGGLNIQSLISQFTGGGGANTANAGSAGIMDTIKGIFGK
jgi:aspartyl aminopeptidase